MACRPAIEAWLYPRNVIVAGPRGPRRIRVIRRTAPCRGRPGACRCSATRPSTNTSEPWQRGHRIASRESAVGVAIDRHREAAARQKGVDSGAIFLEIHGGDARLRGPPAGQRIDPLDDVATARRPRSPHHQDGGAAVEVGGRQLAAGEAGQAHLAILGGGRRGHHGQDQQGRDQHQRQSASLSRRLHSIPVRPRRGARETLENSNPQGPRRCLPIAPLADQGHHAQGSLHLTRAFRTVVRMGSERDHEVLLGLVVGVQVYRQAEGSTVHELGFTRSTRSI